MLIEQEFEFNKKSIDIFETLLISNKKSVEIEKDISMLYIGSKTNEFINQIKNCLKNNEIQNDKIPNINITTENKNKEVYEEDEKNKNILFLMQYKNIYIGGISLDFHFREGFGINKYENSSSFYIGQWKENMKEGIGFLKIDENTLYIGSFHLNQFEGFGILYYKSHNIFYLGEFKNGTFIEGIFCNISKELYYRGKFNQNKKNDSFCTFLEKKNKNLYIGEVRDDIFVKGYLCIYQINEINRQDESGVDELVAYFDIDTIFYFDKSNDKNISFIDNSLFDNDFRNKIQENTKKIFEADYRISHKITDIIGYFQYLESLENDEDYNFLEKYIEDDENYQEKFFMRNYSIYFHQFQETKNDIDINEIRKEIEIPEINKDNDKKQ